MSCIEEMCPEELVLLASSIALKISKNKNADEISNLGNFFSAIGQNLSLIAGSMEE